MAKNKIVESTSGVVALLEPLSSEERSRVISAALTMLGDQLVAAPAATPLGAPPAKSGGSGATERTSAAPANEKSYFDAKEPGNKGEELAVAARFREEALSATQSTRQDLEAVIRAARRNFDGGNYRRDIENARNKGLFNRGGTDVVLSHYGQSVVDALPDRVAVKAIRKPKRTAAKRAPLAKRVARKKADK